MYTHTQQSTPISSRPPICRVESKRRVDGWIDDVKDYGWMDAIVRHSVRDDDEGGAGERERERERRCAARRGVGAMPARAG